jgi:hypothetical protein
MGPMRDGSLCRELGAHVVASLEHGHRSLAVAGSSERNLVRAVSELDGPVDRLQPSRGAR